MIIFGTTRGLGAALLEYASKYKENDFISVNRRKIVLEKNTRETRLCFDLAKPSRQKDLDALFSFLKPRMSYKQIFLVCNAATIEPIRPVGRAGAQDIQRHYYTNLVNYAIVINEFIGRSAAFNKVAKKIAIISSGAADSPHHGLSLYCSSKAALEMLGRCVFEEQKKLKQVQILSVRPGVIDTGMQEQMRKSPKNNFDKVDLFKKLYSDGALASSQKTARQIYKILVNDKFWKKPVLNLNEID